MYVDAFHFGFFFFGVRYSKYALPITVTLSRCNTRTVRPLLFCMVHLTATAQTAVVRIDTQFPAVQDRLDLSVSP